jgi:hypothetical protein
MRHGAVADRVGCGVVVSRSVGLPLGELLTSGLHIVELTLLPFVVALLASHVDRASGRIARVMVMAAASLVPSTRRRGEREEWLDHVESAGEHGLLPLTRALSVLLLAAPLLAIGLRVGRSRHRIPQ